MLCPGVPTPITKSPARPTAERLTYAGRLFFAAALIFWGVQHFYFGNFVTRAMPAWPEGVPLRAMWPHVVGVVFVLGGAAILVRKFARRAALFIATIVLIGAAVLAVPNAFNDVRLGGLWTHAGKAFVIGGGALLVAATFPVETGSPTDRVFVAFARAALGSFMMLAGVQHFVWAEFVHTLVPPWMPGGSFWTYFSAIALIAGGVGVILPATTRLAALISGLMIFAWVWMVHAPRALLTVRNANEATALFEAIAFSGIAFLLATSPGLTDREATQTKTLSPRAPE